MAADAVFGTGDADDADVTDDKRRHRESFAAAGIAELGLPDDLAARLGGLDHPAVDGDRNHLVLPQRDAAIVDAAAGDVAAPGLIDLRVHHPVDLGPVPGVNVELVDAAPA